MLATLALALSTQDVLAALPPWASAEALAIASKARGRSHFVGTERRFVTTPDGVRLATDCFWPKGHQKAPTILARLPLGDHPWHSAYAQLLGHLWASRGYTVVVQRTRGKPGSTGHHEAMVHEVADGQATLLWLRQQSWWDGRFATFGGSAFGYNQWPLTGAPELKAQLIQIANAEPAALLRPGGAFALFSALHWACSDGPMKGAWPSAEDMAPGLRLGLPAAQAAQAAGAPDEGFGHWALNPSGSPFWRALDLRPRIALAQAPVLMMAGWHDPYLPGQLEDWQALRSHPNPAVREGSRLVVGPWAHARELSWPGAKAPGDYRLASLAAALPWFDAHLPPEGVAKPPTGPRVQAYLRGTESWLPLADWPPPNGQRLSYRLAWPESSQPLRGALQPQEAPAATGAAAFRLHHDPTRPVVVRGGASLGAFSELAPQGPWPEDGRVVALDAAPFAQDTLLAGEISLSLGVAGNAPEADLIARLAWVDAQGQCTNLSDGVQRLRLQQQPKPFRLQLAPSFTRLPAGSHLRLLLMASAFPLFAVHPNRPGLPPEAAPTGAPMHLNLGGIGLGPAEINLRSWVLTPVL